MEGTINGDKAYIGTHFYLLHLRLQAAAKSLHVIYNSIAFDHNVEEYLALLRNQGTMVLVGGVPVGAMPKGSFALIGRGACTGPVI